MCSMKCEQGERLSCPLPGLARRQAERLLPLIHRKQPAVHAGSRAFRPSQVFHCPWQRHHLELRSCLELVLEGPGWRDHPFFRQFSIYRALRWAPVTALCCVVLFVELPCALWLKRRDPALDADLACSLIWTHEGHTTDAPNTCSQGARWSCVHCKCLYTK